MRLSNKCVYPINSLQVKSIFGNVGGYMSGPTSNGMALKTRQTEKARNFVVACFCLLWHSWKHYGQNRSAFVYRRCYGYRSCKEVRQFSECQFSSSQSRTVAYFTHFYFLNYNYIIHFYRFFFFQCTTLPLVGTITISLSVV